MLSSTKQGLPAVANPDYRLVLSTCPDLATAETLATRLVEEGLVACVNIVPGMRSVYAWRGAVERSDECLLLMKTVAARFAAIEARVKALHSYELPELIAVPISEGLPEYLQWVTDTANS